MRKGREKRPKKNINLNNMEYFVSLFVMRLRIISTTHLDEQKILKESFVFNMKEFLLKKSELTQLDVGSIARQCKEKSNAQK
ncbi:CLUMA_CG010805, isoform A [Clunio marinus]|uniref:CLUMA_CG010805, isoform A n=1 Tax=Clunio marinus TaxID=568069 RepID=A0A1J1IB02_9DIPT|nr:CLUMA_CG010805, isoform A [Clunio marinus]